MKDTWRGNMTFPKYDDARPDAKKGILRIDLFGLLGSEQRQKIMYASLLLCLLAWFHPHLKLLLLPTPINSWSIYSQRSNHLSPFLYTQSSVYLFIQYLLMLTVTNNISSIHLSILWSKLGSVNSARSQLFLQSFCTISPSQVHSELYAILNSDHVIFVISSPFVSAAK